MKKVLILIVCAQLTLCEVEKFKRFGDREEIGQTVYEMWSDHKVQEQVQDVKDIFAILYKKAKADQEALAQKVKDSPELQDIKVTLIQKLQVLRVINQRTKEKAELVDKARLDEQKSLDHFMRKAKADMLTLKDAKAHADVVKRREELEKNTAFENREAMKDTMMPLLADVAKGTYHLLRIVHEVDTQK